MDENAGTQGCGGFARVNASSTAEYEGRRKSSIFLKVIAEN